MVKNLKKEFSEKVEESNKNEAKVGKLEEREKQLLEENRLVSEDHDRKVAELTQLHDEVESRCYRLEESKKARAEEKVSTILSATCLLLFLFIF